MRGTRDCPRLRREAVGIIPAYAGNTFFRSFVDEWGGDHPRVCGEHAYQDMSSGGVKGSSPRMRGTLPRDITELESCGIIPAYAGNTVFIADAGCPVLDHPRVCGEHLTNGVNGDGYRGSSPRMRGTLVAELPLHGLDGIIPAYAGNTLTCTSRRSRPRDHPRVCGEHGYIPPLLLPLPGSSPRMRGTPKREDARHRLPWIIPAYAGNTDPLH